MGALPRNRRDRMLCLDIVARAPTVERNRSSRFLVSGYRAACHTGIDVLVNAARPRKVEKETKTKEVKRSAFRKTVAGKVMDFEELVVLVGEKCAAVNEGLSDGKMVVAVTRDISK